VISILLSFLEITNERTNEEFIAGGKAHKTQHKYST